MTPRLEGPWQKVSRAQEQGTLTGLEPQNESRDAVRGFCWVEIAWPFHNASFQGLPLAKADLGACKLQPAGGASCNTDQSRGKRRKGVEGKWQKPRMGPEGRGERERERQTDRQTDTWGKGRGNRGGLKSEQEGNIRPEVA